MNLFIATPSCRDPKFGYSISMLNLYIQLTKNGVNGKQLDGLVMDWRSQSSLLSAARQGALDTAIKEGATHLFMVDDDMSFPRNVIDRLAAHDKDFIACNYASKGNCLPTAVGKEGKVSSLGKTGLEEIGWVGMGCCLLRLSDAVKAIKPPHFEVMWLEETQSYLGEDYYFSEKLRHNNITLYIDHDLSNEIGHIGDYTYKEKGCPVL